MYKVTMDLSVEVHTFTTHIHEELIAATDCLRGKHIMVDHHIG
jgi:hypothetical protein